MSIASLRSNLSSAKKIGAKRDRAAAKYSRTAELQHRRTWSREMWSKRTTGQCKIEKYSANQHNDKQPATLKR